MTNCETILSDNDSKCFKPSESGKGLHVTRDEGQNGCGSHER